MGCSATIEKLSTRIKPLIKGDRFVRSPSLYLSVFNTSLFNNTSTLNFTTICDKVHRDYLRGKKGIGETFIQCLFL